MLELDSWAAFEGAAMPGAPPPPPPKQLIDGAGLQAVLEYLEKPSVAERLSYTKQDVTSMEVDDLLAKSSFVTLAEKTLLLPPRNDLNYATMRYCQAAGKENCRPSQVGLCNKIHYKKLLQQHTDLSLGDCSYLDTCRHLFSCKFVHYLLDLDIFEKNLLFSSDILKHRLVPVNESDVLERQKQPFEDGDEGKETWYQEGVIKLLGVKSTPPQWIRCDLRSLDLGIFRGHVSVVMADPPWDIRMDLPYGTMTDPELKSLRVDLIQEEGLIFLWVTGRAMELARECMTTWGYTRIDEIVWVKTNHLHRVIRTGRTGHWLNHSKEHCLVGIKGNPRIHKQVEADVIVSEVRETSRKPDEIYRMIERISPHGLKLELFGRQHNLRDNWITLGNQLDGVCLRTPSLIRAFQQSPGGKRQVCFEEEQRLRMAAEKSGYLPHRPQ